MGKGTRTDIYLYGHPMGPRKRFRSPREFEKHLIWLASDMTRNPANCGCDKCKGDGYRQPPEMPMQSTPHTLPNSATETAASSAPQYSTGDQESTPGPGTRNVTPKVTEPPPPS